MNAEDTALANRLTIMAGRVVTDRVDPMELAHLLQRAADTIHDHVANCRRTTAWRRP